MNEQLILGDWSFDVDAGSLTKQGCTTRLEDRSARTLALLCRRRGEVVSKAQILDEVWMGRTVSENSVAIVIADLRRALGESSRAPQHIETIGKRGYRLRGMVDIRSQENPATVESRRWRVAWLYAGIAAILVSMLVYAVRPVSPIALAILPVRNDTGDPRYEPLANALSALVQEKAARMPGLVATVSKRVVSYGGRRLEMRSRLIIWNDTPTLSLAAIDPTDGRVVWSGMAVGRPNAIADATIAKLADFRRHL